jgi:hypothetical protein
VRTAERSVGSQAKPSGGGWCGMMEDEDDVEEINQEDCWELITAYFEEKGLVRQQVPAAQHWDAHARARESCPRARSNPAACGAARDADFVCCLHDR